MCLSHQAEWEKAFDGLEHPRAEWELVKRLESQGEKNIQTDGAELKACESELV